LPSSWPPCSCRSSPKKPAIPSNRWPSI
jgi:hypothetical protein